MRAYPAATDSYRVFSALCRMCQSPVSWYASGPAQKYILRQIKAMDRALLPAELAEKVMAAAPAWDKEFPSNSGGGDAAGSGAQQQLQQQQQQPRYTALDVTLLMLYGHILLTSTSYTYALNYFLRAAALDPENPMVNLSTGLAYVHYAMKRQVENRQFILAQGLHYFFKYYEARITGSNGNGFEGGSEEEKEDVLIGRLEANYNLARCYHLLGIYHLAAKFYGLVLREAAAATAKEEEEASDANTQAETNKEVMDSENVEHDEEEQKEKRAKARGKPTIPKEFVYESAVNLRTFALTNGDFDGARAVTETWLVL